MDKLVSGKLENFFSKYKYQQYKKGEILIRADDSPSGIFYLKQGNVKEYAISKKGEELILNTFKPISFFPMSWAISNTDNNYYYEAVTDVEVFMSEKEEVINFIKKNPDVLYDLLRRVYLGIDGLISRMVYLMSENAHDRTIIELLIHIRRFGKKISEKSYQVEISERDIAAKSGMTRETVSREISQLKSKGLVSFNKGILNIQNISNLEHELYQNL